MAEKWSQMHDSIKYHNDLTPRERIIFCDIRDLTKNGEGLCKARNRYLATKHRISARTISRAVTKFVELGLVAIEMNHANNTRYLRVIETKETGVQKCLDEETKMSSRIDKNVVTYRQKCLPLYNEEKYNRELQGRESGPEPPSLSQVKFSNTFPKIEVNCGFKPFHDVDLLIKKIGESKWLRDEGENKGLAWLLLRYKKIILNEHKDNLPAHPTPPPEKSLLRHNYAPSELGQVFTDLDNVSFG